MKTASALALSAVILSACAGAERGTRTTATADIEPLSDSRVSGRVVFTEIGKSTVRITGEAKGMREGPKGFHIHEKGDCSDPKGMSAGGHFNPDKAKHGGPFTPGRHAGDLGNIVFNDLGQAKIDMTVNGISLSGDGPNGVLGRAVVIHAEADDLKTDPSGNSGARVACGVIK